MIVIDASVALSWFFRDEIDDLSRTAAERVLIERAVVPAIFPAELANAFSYASRKGRISTTEIASALTHVAALPITIESPAYEFHEELRLAAKHRLSIYDSLYLALAQRRKATLLTRDVDLIRAAKAERVSLA